MEILITFFSSSTTHHLLLGSFVNIGRFCQAWPQLNSTSTICFISLWSSNPPTSTHPPAGKISIESGRSQTKKTDKDFLKTIFRLIDQLQSQPPPNPEQVILLKTQDWVNTTSRTLQGYKGTTLKLLQEYFKTTSRLTKTPVGVLEDNIKGTKRKL